MAIPSLPFFPCSCLKCLSTFPTWICSLCPWPLLPALNLSPSRTHALLESSSHLLSWDPQAGLNLPILQSTSHRLLLPSFADLHPFFFPLLNISKEQSTLFSYFPHNPLVSTTLDRLWIHSPLHILFSRGCEHLLKLQAPQPFLLYCNPVLIGDNGHIPPICHPVLPGTLRCPSLLLPRF